ncbi:MAG: metalloregulator ArsR/SmtB family transcription factor [Bdellovibrionota bacterium]
MEPLTRDEFKKAAECLRVLAHPHRLEMLSLLLEQRMTVGELGSRCGVASAVCSEHLRTMERCGFLTSERDGRFVFYSVCEPQIKNILSCMRKKFKE